MTWEVVQTIKSLGTSDSDSFKTEPIVTKDLQDLEWDVVQVRNIRIRE